MVAAMKRLASILIVAVAHAIGVAACGSSAGPARLLDVSDALIDHQVVELPERVPTDVAYNASIAQLQNEFVMVFRLDRPSGVENHLGSQNLAVVALDRAYNPKGPYTVLPTPHEPGAEPSAEDPRVIVLDDTPYVIYNAAVHTGTSRGRRMFVARLSINANDVTQPAVALDVAKEIHLVHPGFGTRVEKNWTPFVYEGALHLIYQTNPSRVYRLDMDTLDDPGSPWAVAHFVSQSEQHADFSFGPMRGGTPALYCPELDQYLSFFHGTRDANFGIGRQCYYMMGAYTFDTKPPFNITSLTQDPFDIPEPDARPVGSSRVVYPQGFVADGNTFVISYGRNDVSIFLLTLSKQGVFDRLVPVH